MKISILLYLTTVLTISIPISSSLSSKFKHLKSDHVDKSHQSNLVTINDRVLNSKQLGNKVDLVVNHIKDGTEISGVLEDSEVSRDSKYSEDSVDPDQKITTKTHTTIETSGPIPDSTYKSSRNFIKDFFNFQSFKVQSTGKLSTSIKNYDTSLSTPNLKSYTEKVIEETRTDSDFDDYNFNKYSHVKQEPDIPFEKLDIKQFIDYLVTYEGFTPLQLQFLNRESVDFGYDEIEKELNKIKDIQREERRIEIPGENGATTILISYNILLAIMFFIF